MNINYTTRYLDAVVAEYEADSFDNVWEAKKKLWKCAVIVWENDPKPEGRINQLRDLALDHGVKPTDIGTTIESARKRAFDD